MRVTGGGGGGGGGGEGRGWRVKTLGDNYSIIIADFQFLVFSLR